MIGEQIYHYRKLKNMTRKELAYNTCDESTLYRIEKGKHIPRVDVFFEICEKLNVNPTYLIKNQDEINIFYPF